MEKPDFDNIEWTPVLSKPQARRIAVERMAGPVPSVTMRWPNELGEKPSDALGKMVRLTEYGKSRYFAIKAVEGDKLILSRAPSVEAE